MRKTSIPAIVVVAIAVVGILALPHLVDINQYHGQIQNQLQQRLNRPLQLRETLMRISTHGRGDGHHRWG